MDSKAEKSTWHSPCSRGKRMCLTISQTTFLDDMEIEMTPPPKKKKKKVDQTGIQHSAEAMASLLDDADEARVSKAQSNWEKKRAGNGAKKRSKKAKRSKLLN